MNWIPAQPGWTAEAQWDTNDPESRITYRIVAFSQESHTTDNGEHIGDALVVNTTSGWITEPLSGILQSIHGEHWPVHIDIRYTP